MKNGIFLLKSVKVFSLALLLSSSTLVSTGRAQEFFPQDDGLSDYHSGPDYRESESHPLRIIGYALHPVGWVLREVIFRPLSWFASSTEETRSIMGYRDPRDFRSSDCFSTDDSAPDCHSTPPFNYNHTGAGAGAANFPLGKKVDMAKNSREVFFPEVNFDFNKSTLNDLGRGRIHQIADLLKNNEGARIVLEGHADSKGTDLYNEKLGSSRADAVKMELAALGVTSDRMSTVTFGKTQPELNGSEPWARAVNRRVEVRVE